ncbi:hypothetical protein [Saccharopolyspora gregorii]|uniref:hypothetical protein n=1 Tax=Saccharopolyspora gregorii TaxID=33914 RepID=UPI0021AD07AA|nr:hypothetical protein [Saccharopolyspora gregorii]
MPHPSDSAGTGATDLPEDQVSGSSISVHVFAERLTELLAAQPDPETGKPYGSERMAGLLTARGVRMSGTHMWHLRTGRAVPRLTEVVAFAEFFGVGLDFFDPAIAPELLAQWRLAGQLRSHGVEEVALRQLTDQFPEQDRQHVADAILGVLHGFKALRAADQQPEQR